ncbi:MAG: hypothetical protein ACYC91_13630 [Solirubrobacteraceae bacterium]
MPSAADAPGRARSVKARAGAVLGRALGIWSSGRERLTAYARRARAAQVRPDHDPLDVDVDRDARRVVLAQPPVPERPLAGRPEVSGGEDSDLHPLLRGGLRDHPRVALYEHVARTGGGPMLAGVERHRDARVARDALELLAEAKRRREPDRAGGTVAQSNRRYRLNNHSASRRAVSQRRGQVAGKDGVDVVTPGECHLRLGEGDPVAVALLSSGRPSGGLAARRHSHHRRALCLIPLVLSGIPLRIDGTFEDSGSSPCLRARGRSPGCRGHMSVKRTGMTTCSPV